MDLNLVSVQMNNPVFVLTDRGADLRGGGILIDHFLLVDLQSLSHPSDYGSELFI